MISKLLHPFPFSLPPQRYTFTKTRYTCRGSYVAIHRKIMSQPRITIIKQNDFEINRITPVFSAIPTKWVITILLCDHFDVIMISASSFHP